jgi:hypothetical protein
MNFTLTQLNSTYDIVCEGDFMPRGRASSDTTMLAMALVGYELEKQKIEEKIREIRARLGGRQTGGVGGPAAGKEAAPRHRRTLSVAARRRIAAAQRKRWAEHRKKLAQSGKGE